MFNRSTTLLFRVLLHLADYVDRDPRTEGALASDVTDGRAGGCVRAFLCCGLRYQHIEIRQAVKVKK